MADMTKTNSVGFGEKVKRFFKECKAEIKKVTWPAKEQLIHNSTVIIVFIAIITVILSVLDVAFAKLFSLVTNLL